MKNLLLYTTALSISLLGQPAFPETLRGTGEAMSFDIGYGIIVNKGSKLTREWVIVNDDRLPVKIAAMNASTLLSDRNWIYNVDYTLSLREPISAVEVRFIPFNIWGEKDRALSVTEISEIEAGEKKLSAKWSILSENDAVEHYAMLGYVAQIKLASGAIIRADTEAVVDAAREFSGEFTSGDLSSEK